MFRFKSSKFSSEPSSSSRRSSNFSIQNETLGSLRSSSLCIVDLLTLISATSDADRTLLSSTLPFYSSKPSSTASENPTVLRFFCFSPTSTSRFASLTSNFSKCTSLCVLRGDSPLRLSWLFTLAIDDKEASYFNWFMSLSDKSMIWLMPWFMIFVA